MTTGTRVRTSNGSAADGEVVRRWALGSAAAVFAVAASSACTFYTGCPDQPANNNPGGGNSSTDGGKSNSGGSSNNGGTSVGEAGAGGAGLPEQRPWQPVVGNLEGRSSGCGVIFIAAHPARDELLLGVDQFGLWHSTEEGTWSALGTGSQSAVIMNGMSDIDFEPEDPDTFWEAGIYNGPGGFKTTDGGVNFAQLGDLKHVDSISVDFTDPDRQTLIAGPHERSGVIWKSTDGGESWVELTNLPEGFGFSSNVHVVDADTYVVGVTLGIIRTTDGGDSWEVVSRIGGHMDPLVASDGAIYWNAEGNQGIVKSTDEGLTWERLVGGGVLSAARPPLELPDGRLAALQGQGVVVSSDGGFSWDPIGEEAPITIKGFVYSAERKAFYVTTDGCDAPIGADAVLKLDFDYQAE